MFWLSLACTVRLTSLMITLGSDLDRDLRLGLDLNLDLDLDLGVDVDLDLDLGAAFFLELVFLEFVFFFGLLLLVETGIL